MRSIGGGMWRKIVYLCQCLLSGLGVVWLFLEAYNGLGVTGIPTVGFGEYIVAGLTVGFLWYIVDGYCISGILCRKIQIKSNAIDTPITIMFGDIFKQKGCKAIPVNNFFDSIVDDRYIAKESLHGIMLMKYWGGNTEDWDKQVEKELSHILSDEIRGDRNPAKRRCFPIGSTALARSGEQDFLCVALTNTDSQTNEVHATSKDLYAAILGLLNKSRAVCSGRTLNIPLLGSGLARTGIKPNIIVDLILLAIFEESKKRKITGHIRIVLPKRLSSDINLSSIYSDWK